MEEPTNDTAKTSISLMSDRELPTKLSFTWYGGGAKVKSREEQEGWSYLGPKAFERSSGDAYREVVEMKAADFPRFYEARKKKIKNRKHKERKRQIQMEKRETPTCWSVDFLLTPLTTLMENKSRSKSRMQQQNIKLQSVINTLSRPERDLLLDTLSKSQLQSLSQHLLHEGWVVTSKKSPEGKDCPRYNLYFRYSGSGQDCDPVRVQPKSSVRKGHGLKGGGQIPARSYYKLLKVPNIIVHKLLLMFFTNFVTLFYIKQLAITLI